MFDLQHTYYEYLKNKYGFGIDDIKSIDDYCCEHLPRRSDKALRNISEHLKKTNNVNSKIIIDIIKNHYKFKTLKENK